MFRLSIYSEIAREPGDSALLGLLYCETASVCCAAISEYFCCDMYTDQMST